MSEDDATAAQQDNMEGLLMGFFVPIDPIALLLFALAWFMHRRAKKSQAAPVKLSRTGFVLALVAFAVSFLKVSIVLPLLVNAAGMGVTDAESDYHQAVEGEYSISNTELVSYVGMLSGDIRRVSGTVTNTSPYDWEAVSLRTTMTDAAGTECLVLDQDLTNIAVGQSADFSTDKEYVDASSGSLCVPTGMRIEVSDYDIDSRAVKTPAGYTQPEAPTFSALAPQEESYTYSDEVRIAVAGTVTSGWTAGGKTLNFELVDQQGMHLDGCFRGEPAADGTFTTPQWHDPVDPGIYLGVVVVADC
ncbi:MAG: hypothetical protein JWQ43_3424 [Glaciihabitans sp.]|nr:hypothetical protein [Glaciihabitans sp.]